MALDIAASAKNAEIIQLLTKAGAASSQNKSEGGEDEKSRFEPEFKIEMKFVGKKVVIRPEWTGIANLSDSPESWSKENEVASVKANTNAEILEIRAYRPDSGNPLRRFKVKTEDGHIGWISLSDLLCTSFMCDDDHPQRSFPFDIR